MSLLVWLGTLFGAFALCQLIARQSVPSRLETVAGPKRERWLTGNFHRLFKDGLEYNLGLVRQYGGVVKVHGLLGAQQLLVSDPRALHHIIVKDQDIYHETDMFLMANHLIFGEGLIATVGEQHKKQRKMLNPVFSFANMRAVLPAAEPIARKFLERIRAQLPRDGDRREVDILPWAGRVTMDLIGSAVLGIPLHALDPEKTKEHATAIRNVSRTALKVLVLRPFIPVVVRNFSLYWRNKMVDWLPFPALREMRELSRVLDGCARSVFHEKKVEMENGIAAFDHDDPCRNLMSIMLEANQSTSEKERLTDEELIGQINTLLIGGDTVTTAVARIFWILACEQGAQTRLRSEIRKAKVAAAAERGMPEHEWDQVSLSYDTLVGLPYLDAVVRETLRMYPPTTLINRVATKDTILPLQHPIRVTTGEETAAVHVPAGTNVIISIIGANRNRRIWGDDADEWRPERWLTAGGERIGWGKNADLAFDGDDDGAEGRNASVAEGTPGYRDGVKYPGVYATMMTFLGGSRACIGFKVAEMELKLILATVLPVLHFSLPLVVNKEGMQKKIYWRIDGLQVPVVLPPHGDGKTASVPLDIRLAKGGDFP